MNSMAFNSARIIGPSLAGLLVVFIHESGCFFLNGISFIAVLIGLALLRLPPHVVKPRQESYWENLLAGIQYVRTSRILCGLLALVSVPSILTLSYQTLMPVFAKDIFGKNAAGMGILMACTGIGAILGALFVARISHSKFKGKVLLIGNLGSNLFILCFGLSHYYYLSCVLLVCIGLFNVMYLTTTNTLIQSNSQDEYRGRAVSFYTLIFQGMMPIGSLVMGTLASWFSAPTTISICAIVTMLYSIYINKNYPELEKLP
jgi:predicted MFS family arabinose efflux permease